MKKLLFALLMLYSTVSYAKPNALCMMNNAGGKIIVTQKYLEDKRGIVISTMASGKVMYGAWTLVGKRTIHIEWENGDTSMFDMLDFSLCTY